MKKKLLSYMLICAIVLPMCACSDNGESADIQLSTTESVVSTVEDGTANYEAVLEGDETDELTDYASGSPWVNSDIAANVISFYDTDLKDDYALAINKDWILENPIADGSAYNLYANGFDCELNNRLIQIVSDEVDYDNHDAVLVSQYYDALLDWDARNEAGVAPLMPYIDAINNINSVEDLYAYLATDTMKPTSVFRWQIGISPRDASLKNIVFTSPGFFLSDPAVYSNLDELDEYSQLLYDYNYNLDILFLSRCGYTESEIDDIFAGALEFEKIVSQYCYTYDEACRTDVYSTLNEQLYTYDEITQFEGMQVYLDTLEAWGFTDIPEIQLDEKIDYFEHFNDIYNDDNIELIKDYLLAHSAETTVCYLDKDIYYGYLDLYNERGGSSGYKSDVDSAIIYTSEDLGWPLSKLYCERYVTEEDKENVYNVITEIIDEYKLMIAEEDFLSDETKANAIYKLDNMIIKCMYPDKWPDYSGLELEGSLVDMYLSIYDYRRRLDVAAFNEAVDRNAWGVTPITNNAFYEPNNNSIIIMPAFVGDLLYNEDMEKEEVYAYLGSVVAHEISHGFDPTGGMYDATGNFADWWTEEDYDAYNILTDKLIEYYDGIEIWDGFYCNGEIVKGESCAEMASIACLLRLAEKDPDFDYDLFFSSYARLWAMNSSPEFELFAGMYDAHPLCYLRVNVTVAQFDEFYETYDIQEGDGMYIAPEDRIKIW